MAQKPGNLIYGLDEKPPLLITFFLALQHISVISIGFLFPVIIVREIGGGNDYGINSEPSVSDRHCPECNA